MYIDSKIFSYFSNSSDEDRHKIEVGLTITKVSIQNEDPELKAIWRKIILKYLPLIERTSKSIIPTSENLSTFNVIFNNQHLIMQAVRFQCTAGLAVIDLNSLSTNENFFG